MKYQVWVGGSSRGTYIKQSDLTVVYGSLSGVFKECFFKYQKDYNSPVLLTFQ